jgi:hypothetical protein
MQPYQNQSPQQPPQPPPPQAPPGQPHYMQVQHSERAVTATTQKGQRDIAFGVVWIVVGLLITGITYSSDMPIYVVAWGPVLYGIIKVIVGVVRLNRS